MANPVDSGTALTAVDGLFMAGGGAVGAVYGCLGAPGKDPVCSFSFGAVVGTLLGASYEMLTFTVIELCTKLPDNEELSPNFAPQAIAALPALGMTALAVNQIGQFLLKSGQREAYSKDKVAV